MPFDILLFMTFNAERNKPIISEATAESLIRLLPRLAVTEQIRIMEIAIVASHVHMVFRCGRAPDFPKIAQRLKGASARLINQNEKPNPPLHWLSGYDIRSVGRRSIPAIRRYFDWQAEHHHMPWVKRFSDEAHLPLGWAPLAALSIRG